MSTLEPKGSNPTDHDVWVAQDAITITPSDATLLAIRALYVGGTGNVTVQPLHGAGTVVFSAVPVGTILPIAIKRVLSTGTTATLMVGLV